MKAKGYEILNVDLKPLVRFVLGETPGELVLHFESVRLNDFEAAIQFDPGGKLRLLDAFVFPPKPATEGEPSSGEGLKVKRIGSVSENDPYAVN